MFSNQSPTHARLAWSLVLLLLILFSPVSLEWLMRSNEQARCCLHEPLSQDAEAASPPGQSRRPATQQPPESIVKNLVLAWNRGDSEAVVRCFLPEGVLIVPTGSVIRSRGAIRKRILDERKGRLKESILSNTVENVSLIDANTALIKGRYVLDGMKVLGVKTSPEGSYILRQKKQQGGWMIEKAEVLGKK